MEKPSLRGGSEGNVPGRGEPAFSTSDAIQSQLGPPAEHSLELLESHVSCATGDWAQRIIAAWRSSIDHIVETGRLLIAAKAAVDHGAWLNMIERELPFGIWAAERLMAIARNPVLSNSCHGTILPASWRTLSELARLPEEVLEARLADGSIHPEMRRKDVARENRLLTLARDEKRVAALEPAPGRFRALIVDPPWDYEGLSIAGRAAPLYATMSLDELRALDVAQWAEPDCHLYLWATNAFVNHGFALMAAWGFSKKTVLTWVKPRMGLGAYFRNQTEHVLFGIRGTLRTRSDSIPTYFQAPLGGHSEKPEQFYNIVRQASHRPFGELFQRQARPDFANVFQPQPEAA